VFGSAANLWGQTLAQTDFVGQSSTGVAFSAANDSTAGDASVSLVRMRVTYSGGTSPGAGGSNKMLMGVGC
jgi:hypothetical protein